MSLFIAMQGLTDHFMAKTKEFIESQKQQEELKNDKAWEEYLDAKDYRSNLEFDEPKEDDEQRI